MPENAPPSRRHHEPDPLHPPHDAVCLNRAPTRIVAQWPTGTFLENLAPGPDGQWLVTSPSDRTVYRVHTDGRVGAAAVFDGRAGVDGTPTGIVIHPDGGVLTAVGTAGRADWRLHRITADGARDCCPLPNVLSANGMAWSGDRLLVVDSGRSVVVEADVTAGTTRDWLAHPLLTPRSPDSPLPGVNGIGVRDGVVYVSSSDRGLILAAGAADPDDELRTVAERLVADDFAVAPDGRIFLATHTYHSVLCLYPDGRREDVADHADGIAGPTAVAIGADDALYVSTSGGLLSPPAGVVEPARLIRVDALGR